MKKKHTYTALIIKIPSGLYIGAILEVGGAASFAETKTELISGLIDAANCIRESNKAEFGNIFKKEFKAYGNPIEELIPCSL